MIQTVSLRARKKYPRTLLLAVTAAGLLATGCKGHKPDANVLAQVNDYQISRAEFDKNYTAQTAGSAQKLSPADDQVLRLKLLRQLIELQLQLQKAAKVGVKVSDDDVSTKFNQAKAPYTQEEFANRLKQMGFSEDDYKQELKRELTVNKLIDQEVSSKVVTSDADIQSYYDQHKSDFNVPETQYDIGHIFVTSMPTGSSAQISDKAQNDAQAQQKIKAAYKALENGEDFAAVARRYSEDPESRNNGGELGSLPESQLGRTDLATQQAVTKLKPGQYSSPLPVVDPRAHQVIGYRIVHLTSKNAAGQRELNDPQVQQFIRTQLRKQKEQFLAAVFDDVLHNGAQIHNYYAEEILKNNQKK